MHPNTHKTKNDLIEKFKSIIEEYSEVPMNPTQFGITTIPRKHVKSEWETTLSDTLFGVVGFSHFFGSLAFRCEYYWTFNIPTAGAGIYNGKFYVFLNPLFFHEYLQKFQYRTFVIVHEVFHIFYDHGDRGRNAGYDDELFNRAADFYNHWMMASMRVTKRTIANLELLPDDVFPICYDEKYHGMTEDEIYRDLEKELKKQNENGDGSKSDDKDEGGDSSGDQGHQDSQEGESSGEGGDSSEGESSSEGEEGEGEEGEGESSSEGEEGEGEEGTSGGKSSDGKEGKGSSKVYDYSKVGKGESLDSIPLVGDQDDAARNKSKMEISTAVRAAAVQAHQANSIGDVEAGIIRQFLSLTEAKVDWRDEVQEYLESTRSEMTTYSYYNRRSSEQIIFPSKTGEFIRVFWGVDTSGSMGQSDLDMAASELQGFLDQVDSWEVKVASADTAAYEIATLYSEEEDSLATVDVDFKGGGGTWLDPMVKLAQEGNEDEEDFNFIVIITDGGLQQGDLVTSYEGEIPMLVLITETGIVPPWLEEHPDIKVVKMEG